MQNADIDCQVCDTHCEGVIRTAKVWYRTQRRCGIQREGVCEKECGVSSSPSESWVWRNLAQITFLSAVTPLKTRTVRGDAVRNAEVYASIPCAQSPQRRTHSQNESNLFAHSPDLYPHRLFCESVLNHLTDAHTHRIYESNLFSHSPDLCSHRPFCECVLHPLAFCECVLNHPTPDDVRENAFVILTERGNESERQESLGRTMSVWDRLRTDECVVSHGRWVCECVVSQECVRRTSENACMSLTKGENESWGKRV